VTKYQDIAISVIRQTCNLLRSELTTDGQEAGVENHKVLSAPLEMNLHALVVKFGVEEVLKSISLIDVFAAESVSEVRSHDPLH
jgi:hypothetical protein